MTILQDLKNFLSVNDNSFDNELLILIQGEILTFIQLGITTFENIGAVDSSTEWPNDSNSHLSGLYKLAFYTSINLAFDPPENVRVIDVIKNKIEQMHHRIIHEFNHIESEEEESND